jgi:hypothetical protein
MLVARQNVYLDAENIFNSSCDGAHLKQEKETYGQYKLSKRQTAVCKYKWRL